MKSYLKKIKFIRSSEIELKVKKKKLYNHLCEIVDNGEPNEVFEPFEIFSSSKNNYIGLVKYGNFKFRRRKKFFDLNPFKPVVEGTFSERCESLVVNFETNALNGVFAMIWIFPLFLMFLIPLVCIGEFIGDESKSQLLIVLILFSIVITSILIIIGRYNSKYFKQEIENCILRLRIE